MLKLNDKSAPIDQKIKEFFADIKNNRTEL